jgi:hypothetical protein
VGVGLCPPGRGYNRAIGFGVLWDPQSAPLVKHRPRQLPHISEVYLLHSCVETGSETNYEVDSSASSYPGARPMYLAVNKASSGCPLDNTLRVLLKLGLLTIAEPVAVRLDEERGEDGRRMGWRTGLHLRDGGGGAFTALPG